MHWDQVDGPLVEFTAAVARLRAAHPTFRRKRFFTGNTVRTGDGERLNDIVWLHPDGRPMEDGDWTAEGAKAIGMYLNGHGIAGLDATGNPIVDDHFLLYFNAGHEDVAGRSCRPRSTPRRGTRSSTPPRAAVTDDAARPRAPSIELAGPQPLVLREHLEPEGEPDYSVAASLVADGGARVRAASRGRAASKP